jgi:hypothetical protein
LQASLAPAAPITRSPASKPGKGAANKTPPRATARKAQAKTQ